MLLRGFTTVRDMAGPVFKAKAAIDAGKADGPRIYPSGTMICQTSGHCDFSPPEDLPRSMGVLLLQQNKFVFRQLLMGAPSSINCCSF